MKERILFVGCGACGSNIANLFEKKGYLALYVNTSNADLNAIEGDQKYHLPATFGCNKDRQKAVTYGAQYCDTIYRVIEERFPQQNLVFFIFGSGGGTGSGLSPAMIEYMINENPDKHYGAIVVLPNENECLQSIRNGLEAYREIVSIEGLKNLYVIDNNKNPNHDSINKRFVHLFDTIVKIGVPNQNSIFDESEIEDILKTPGNTVIEEFNDVGFGYQFRNSIFATHEKGCEIAGYVTTGKLNDSIVHDRFGEPVKTNVGYNAKYNLAIASGLPYPQKTINHLINTLQRRKEERIIVKQSIIDYDIPDIEPTNKIEINEPKKEKKKGKDIFSKYLD